MQFKEIATAHDIMTKTSPLIEDSSGDLKVQIGQFSSVEAAQKDSFIFVMDPKKFEFAVQSQAACILAPSKSKDWFTQNNSGKTILFSKNPELAAREVKKTFVFPTPYQAPLKGIHPTATVAKSAQLSLGVTVGANAFVGENCKIGEGTFIGANAVVEENAIIGNHTTIHPLAYLGHSCEVGDHCELMPSCVVGSEGFGYAHDHLGNHYRVPHTGKVILKNDVHIGASTAIDRGTIDDTIIESGTKIDNQCHIAHNTTIGKNGLITAQFVNAGSTSIGDNFMCGGNSIVAGHIKVGDNIHLAGLSVIANSLDKPGQYGGYPLQPLRDFLKTTATTAHLPEMRKQISKLMRKVFPEDQ